MTLEELRERCAQVAEGARDPIGHYVTRLANMALEVAATNIRAIPLPEERDPKELLDVLKLALAALEDAGKVIGWRYPARDAIEKVLAKWGVK